MNKLQELREKRASIHAQVVEELKKEQTPETRVAVAKMFADIDAIGGDIANIEKADAAAAGLAASSKPGENAPVAAKTERSIEQRAKDYRKAWGVAMRKQPNFRAGSTGVNDACLFGRCGELDERTIETLNREARGQKSEERAEQEGDLISQIGTYTGLGYFVPAGFIYDIENALKYFAPLVDGTVVEIMETATGQPLPYPISNDTDQSAHVLGESVDASSIDLGRGGSPTIDQDVLAGHINFGAWKYTTGLVKISLELSQDSAFNLEKWLAERFAIRLGRGYERDFTVGTGNNQPTGILTAVSNSGARAVIANGSAETSGGAETGANSVGYTDLVRLEHSIDPSYRRGAKYMFHDQTLSHLKRILDKFGRPLWTPGIKEGAPDTVNGYAYVINQAVPQVAASETTVVFGDLKKFLVRKVKDLQVLRLDERFADFGQVAYVAFSRVDSNLVDAGTHPVNVLQQAS
jgi:HK97 family phage major capsid protein